MTFKRLKNLLFLNLAKLPMPGSFRAKVLRGGGVSIPDTTGCFIGERVTVDSNYPELIQIEKGVYITVGCVLLAHFKKIGCKGFYKGNVTIKENAFLGAYCIITKPVIIGANSIVGAGSVITKDIPDNEIWAGVPARFIKKNN